jgi:hypothetical protein
MAKTLGVSHAEATAAIPILEMQGYIKQAGKSEWLTTVAGEKFSQSTMPRFERQAVESSLAALRKRIEELNRHRTAGAIVTKAVAFGDFLREDSGPRVQAADVGLELKPRKTGQGAAAEKQSAKAIFSSLRAKSSTIRLRLYEPWMSQRTHRTLT